MGEKAPDGVDSMANFGVSCGWLVGVVIRQCLWLFHSWLRRTGLVVEEAEGFYGEVAGIRCVFLIGCRR